MKYLLITSSLFVLTACGGGGGGATGGSQAAFLAGNGAGSVQVPSASSSPVSVVLESQTRNQGIGQVNFNGKIKMDLVTTATKPTSGPIRELFGDMNMRVDFTTGVYSVDGKATNFQVRDTDMSKIIAFAMNPTAAGFPTDAIQVVDTLSGELNLVNGSVFISVPAVPAWQAKSALNGTLNGNTGTYAVDAFVTGPVQRIDNKNTFYIGGPVTGIVDTPAGRVSLIDRGPSDTDGLFLVEQ